jgi:hypothetical protein
MHGHKRARAAAPAAARSVQRAASALLSHRSHLSPAHAHVLGPSPASPNAVPPRQGSAGRRSTLWRYTRSHSSCLRALRCRMQR